MAEVTTIGNLLINDALPEGMRKGQHTLDKKGVHKLLMQIAEQHPEKYKQVLNDLSEVGKTAVWTEGMSVSLADLHRSQAKERVLGPVRNKVRELIDDDSLSDEERRKKIIETLLPVAPVLQEAIMGEMRERGSDFATQVESGARGNPGSLTSLAGADLLATDQKGDFIPLPLLRSYSEGFTPAEYFAASYGQRAGQLAVKLATADAGFLCFTGDTLVRMADYSKKPIKDIEAGEWVMGADMQGNMFPVEVLERFDNGSKPVVEYSFRSGRNRQLITLTATPQHEMLAIRKLGKSKQSVLEPTKIPLSKTWGGYGVVGAKGLALEYHSVGEDVGWKALALGLLLGDGGLTGNSTMLACADVPMVEGLNSRWERDNHRLRKVHRTQEHVEWILEEIVPSAFNRDHNGQVIRGARDPFRGWLQELDVLGKLAIEKGIPKEVWGWNQASVADLIAGLIASDGCVTTTNNGAAPVVRFAVISERMVSQFKELLEVRFGIYTTTPACYGLDRVGQVHKQTIQGKDRSVRYNHPIWVVTISQRESLERLLGINIPGAKGSRFRELMQEAGAAKRDERHTFPFVSKREAGVQEVYDLAVDHPDHLYVLASGMIASNSKQLVNATHRQVVTHDEPVQSRLPTGLPVSPSDKDNIGSVLAMDTGKYKAGTILTDEILQDLEDEDTDEILVYSPLTEISEDGGISAKAAGRRQRAGLHLIGDNVGIAAAQAIGEKLSQGSLSAKHSAGVKDRISKAGFEYVNRLLQAPESFPEAGPLSETDGTVNDIADAPQGGKHITVGGQKYYAAPGVEPIVRVGDQVEQGDDLTDGVPHPKDLVRLRGMGEARRTYTKYLYDALKNSGIKTHRRNVESVVAGLLNWAQVTSPDGIGDNIYGDVVPYGRLTANYKPRPTAIETPVSKLRGKYLEEPVLHYTPGTRVTSRVADHLKKYNIKSVFAHDDEPDFEPYMVRSLLSVYHDPDWKTQQSGFYTARAFQKSLHRGAESDTRSTSYVPSLSDPKAFGAGLAQEGKYAEHHD